MHILGMHCHLSTHCAYYAIFIRKNLCLKYFLLLRNKIKIISSVRRILIFFIYYTVLNLDKLKLKEPEKLMNLQIGYQNPNLNQKHTKFFKTN